MEEGVGKGQKRQGTMDLRSMITEVVIVSPDNRNS